MSQAFGDYFKTNLSYYRPDFAKADDDIKSWITVRGAHIPIRDGQSKGEAVKEHLGEEGSKKTPKGSKAIKQEHIDKLKEEAAPAKKEIDAHAHKIADKYGVAVAETDLKSDKSIIRKAIDEHNGDLSKLHDVARNTIVTGHQYVENVLADLKKLKGFMDHKEQTPDKYAGYSGHLLHIKTKNGHIAEIQVNTPEMIYAKEPPEVSKKILGEKLFDKIQEKTGIEPGRGHKHYETIRSTGEGSKKRKAIEESHAYYNDVREKARDLKFEKE